MPMSNQSINRSCPVCNETQTRPFLFKNGFQLVRCAQCAMVYTNPVPAEMASGNFYDQAGHEYLSPEKLESDYSAVRFKRELRLFRVFCPRGSVLDVGCSSGAFLYQLHQQYPNDYQITGTDVSSAPLAYAEKMGVPVIKDNFLTHSFTTQYDAVTFWAVMEHLAEPQLFLDRAAAILKPGGLCFVLVPNLKSLAFRCLGAKYRYVYNEHLNYFTPQTLQKFMEHKFSVMDLKSTHFNPIVMGQDFRGHGQAISRAERVQLLKRTTGYKKSRWMYPVRLGYQTAEAMLAGLKLADNIVIIGRKNRV